MPLGERKQECTSCKRLRLAQYFDGKKTCKICLANRRNKRGGKSTSSVATIKKNSTFTAAATSSGSIDSTRSSNLSVPRYTDPFDELEEEEDAEQLRKANELVEDSSDDDGDSDSDSRSNNNNNQVTSSARTAGTLSHPSQTTQVAKPSRQEKESESSDEDDEEHPLASMEEKEGEPLLQTSYEDDMNGTTTVVRVRKSTSSAGASFLSTAGLSKTVPSKTKKSTLPPRFNSSKFITDSDTTVAVALPPSRPTHVPYASQPPSYVTKAPLRSCLTNSNKPTTATKKVTFEDDPPAASSTSLSSSLLGSHPHDTAAATTQEPTVSHPVPPMESYMELSFKRALDTLRHFHWPTKVCIDLVTAVDAVILSLHMTGIQSVPTPAPVPAPPLLPGQTPIVPRPGFMEPLPSPSSSSTRKRARTSTKSARAAKRAGKQRDTL